MVNKQMKRRSSSLKDIQVKAMRFSLPHATQWKFMNLMLWRTDIGHGERKKLSYALCRESTFSGR